jgi:hypothetical protein
MKWWHLPNYTASHFIVPALILVVYQYGFLNHITLNQRFSEMLVSVYQTAWHYIPAVFYTVSFPGILRCKVPGEIKITDRYFDVETSSRPMSRDLDVVWNVLDERVPVRPHHMTFPYWAVPCLWRLVAGFSSRRAGFGPRSVRVGLNGSGAGVSPNTFLFPCHIRILRSYVLASAEASCI